MAKAILALVLCSLIAACGGAAAVTGGEAAKSHKVDVKVDGKSAVLEERSGGVYLGNVISTAPGKPDVKTSNHYIVIANYEMDTANMRTMGSKMTATGQMRVHFSLTGETGTDEKTPFKIGTYTVKADKFNQVRSFAVYTFADGEDKEHDFDTMSSASKIAGTVKVTSVTENSVSGEIDVTEGDKSVKGNFTAKLPVKK